MLALGFALPRTRTGPARPAQAHPAFGRLRPRRLLRSERGVSGAVRAACPESCAGTGSRAGRRSAILVELVVIVALMIANGLFSAAEIAIVSVRETRLHELARRGSRRARAALSLRARPEPFLATVQVGITVIGSTAAVFGGATFAEHLGLVLARVPALAAYAQGIALVTVVVLISFLSVVVGELVPKSLALRSAEAYALRFARPVLFLSWLMRPIVWLLTASSNVVLRPFRDRTAFTETRFSAEEIEHIVGQAARAGTLHPRASEIVSRTLDFATLTAADVMVPRQDVVMLRRHASAEEVHLTLLEHPHTRLPVFEGAHDNVIGYVTAKDILYLAWDRRLFILEDLLRPAFFVPESKAAIDLLEEMKLRHLPFGVVVDEQGGMSGIVTMEDLVEELVGEIWSEHVREVPELLRVEPEGSLLVSGRAPLREVNRALAAKLSEEPGVNTLGGLCATLAGRIPEVGTQLVVEGVATLEVVEASARRVRMVRIRPVASASVPPRASAPPP